MYKDEKLRNSLVVRAYNRRKPATTVLQQLLSLASTQTGPGGAVAGDGNGRGGLYLNVEEVRAALGLDAKSNSWFDERLRGHFSAVGGVPTT